jgi:hypothetical protein
VALLEIRELEVCLPQILFLAMQRQRQLIASYFNFSDYFVCIAGGADDPGGGGRVFQQVGAADLLWHCTPTYTCTLMMAPLMYACS